MADNSFFETRNEQSQVKTAIVSKYFDAWAQVMIGVQDKQGGRRGDKIAYLDLFAGPGRYDDGTKSTPLIILEKAIASDRLRNRLVTIFNDKEREYTRSLQEAIDNLPGIDSLKHPPKIRNQMVGTEIVKLFQQTRGVPTLFFVDPWGYKGLSLKLINTALEGWGCDCIFFFNYNRINMALPNEAVEEHMNALFEQRAEPLRRKLEGLSPEERELTIVEELCQAIKDTGKKYVLPFTFKTDTGNRTSHHLIFVSKGFRGYEIMKHIMAKESSSADQGVASFEYSPASKNQPFLFEMSRPLDDLESLLLEHFAGRTVTLSEVYEEHNVGTPYIDRNYREALLRLEASGKITTDSPNRRKGSFGPKVKAIFPAKG